jgi:hypothetical protein
MQSPKYKGSLDFSVLALPVPTIVQVPPIVQSISQICPRLVATPAKAAVLWMKIHPTNGSEYSFTIGRLSEVYLICHLVIRYTWLLPYAYFSYAAVAHPDLTAVKVLYKLATIPISYQIQSTRA